MIESFGSAHIPMLVAAAGPRRADPTALSLDCCVDAAADAADAGLTEPLIPKSTGLIGPEALEGAVHRLLDALHAVADRPDEVDARGGGAAHELVEAVLPLVAKVG
jgi:hypothetical protein